MKRTARAVVAAGALGILWTGAVALAEEDTPKQASPLEAVLGVRSEGNDTAGLAQKRIDDISDQTDDLLSQYRTVLKQIDSLNLYNQQMRDLLAAQEAEIASLQDQLGRVQGVGRSVTPLMLRMLDAIEKFVDLDVPFLIDERQERIAALHTMMGRADVTTPEKFRQIMEAYQIENEYGRTIEAYRATLDIEGRETTVDFLRFGRIALVYQSLDESVSGRWDQATRAWVPLDSSHRTSIRQGLRIARKQAAPDLIRLPLAVAVDRPRKKCRPSRRRRKLRPRGARRKQSHSSSCSTW
jgi:hypothetical protein